MAVEAQAKGKDMNALEGENGGGSASETQGHALH